MMPRVVVLAIICTILQISAASEFVELQIEPQNTEPRQYFTLLTARPIFQTVHPTEWLLWATEQTKLLDNIVSTVLGVHPCAYQSWGPVHFWPAYDVDYLEDDDDEEEETYDNLDTYDYTGSQLGRRFGLFNVPTAFAQSAENRELFTGDSAVDIQGLDDDVLTAGSTTPQVLMLTRQPPSEGPMYVGLGGLDRDALLQHVLAANLVEEARSDMALQAVTDRVKLHHMAETGLVDGIVVEEVGLWDGLRAASAWGVMLFLVLVASCLLVWAAFITSCFALRDPAYTQFMVEQQQREDNNLLEPLCLNEYTQPAAVYRVQQFANPAYRRN